jgi:regulatory protein
MGVITAIEAQKKRGDRRSIFVDGDFVAGAHEEVIFALNLKVGQTFDNERLNELIKQETSRKALDKALRLLGYRDRTKSEIRKRLLGDDFPEDTVDNVIGRLLEMGYLDDQKFSRDWVKTRTIAKPMGKTRLAWELRAKGVEQPAVEEALEALDESAETELALELARKKAEKSDISDPSFRTRTASFLRRRGFGWGAIARALDELCPQDGD